jgi:DNA modification methylase/superfamily II DNA or RNA helicase
MTTYEKFLKQKEVLSTPCGINPSDLSPMLFDFQKDIVQWALKRGRAAIFADCGMGKTPMQLEWAKHIPGKVLILAPLAVSEQTVREGEKFGIDVRYQRYGSEDEKITITNYEMMGNFDPLAYTGIILDESSILKSQDGKTRKAIIDAFSKTDYRLACTATPAPNDYMELGNHAEFLGIMSMTEMLSMFFVHDGAETQKWRLKGHAQNIFWKWMASWSVMIKQPSDLGYPDDRFILPALKFHEHVVDSKDNGEYLFPMQAATLPERIKARRHSTSDRVAGLVEVIKQSPDQWLVWCNLNAESNAITKAIPNAVEIQGSNTPEFKASTMMAFTEGKIRVLVTKPSIAGFGMNWQNCHNVAFLGLSDSYEQFYQAIRRCWRFGQKSEVNCHIVIANTEGAVLANIKRKEQDAERMAKNMVEHMKTLTQSEIKGATHAVSEYKTNAESGDGWEILLGDCVEVSRKLPSNSVHYSIFSPPFASLYTYSNSPRDMGNCKTHGEFYAHFKFLVAEMARIMMPGRLVSFHCMNLPTSKQNHGYIGITDFRGDLIRMFQEAGFIYHSEVCIWKDPVTAMQRTKALGLLHKQIKKDSCMSRQGIPDYLVTMRKPGDNPERVSHTNDSFPVHLWQRYASPVWMDIDPSDTITFREARENQDERHICPLQLQVIERGIELWSNPGDTVFSPFAGVGSEGYQAIRQGRKYLGIELKKSYYDQALKNLRAAKSQEMMLV